MHQKLSLEEIQKAMHLSGELENTAQEIIQTYNRFQHLISDYTSKTRGLSSLVPSLGPHFATARANTITKKLNAIDTVALAVKARELRQNIETDETL